MDMSIHVNKAHISRIDHRKLWQPPKVKTFWPCNYNLMTPNIKQKQHKMWKLWLFFLVDFVYFSLHHKFLQELSQGNSSQGMKALCFFHRGEICQHTIDLQVPALVLSTLLLHQSFCYATVSLHTCGQNEYYIFAFIVASWEVEGTWKWNTS